MITRAVSGRTLLFDRTQQQGRLELADRDRFDLLHRMSTNDFSAIQPGEGRPTVLTTALARIIDHVIVYHRGNLALMLTNQPETVRGWLQKHIFFRDKIKIRNISTELSQLEIHGPAATHVAGLVAPGAERLGLHHCLDASLGDGAGTLFVARTYALNGEGFVFVAPVAALDGLKARIMASGDVVLGDESDYERLRILAGMPGPGHELTEDYIPLEAGLWDAVSFTKGCYIGQEIIARMESRNRLAKTLVRLDLAGVVPPGARISADHSRVGTLTSVAALPDGTAIGLGFVKPDRAEPGTRLAVALSEAPDSDQITAEVVAAPLLPARH